MKSYQHNGKRNENIATTGEKKEAAGSQTGNLVRIGAVHA